MGIVNRLKQMVQADANAVLDHIEDPEALLKQSLREMEEALLNDSAELGQLERQQELLIKEIDRQEMALVIIQDELDICLDEKNDSLAKHVVKRKLEATHCLQQTQHRHESISESLKLKTAQYQENKANYESVQQQAQLAMASSQEMSFKNEQNYSVSLIKANTISDEDIAIQLLKEKQKRGES